MDMKVGWWLDGKMISIRTRFFNVTQYATNEGRCAAAR
jgi:hypothetical protein